MRILRPLARRRTEWKKAMNKLQALTALRDKVKAGVEYIEKDIQDVWGGWRDSPASRYAMKVHATGSLDAAKALHEAVLGADFNYSIHRDSASVMTWAHTIQGKVFSATNTDPARAWLLAILEALIQMETQE